MVVGSSPTVPATISDMNKVAIPFKDMDGEDLHIGDEVLVAVDLNCIRKGVIIGVTPKNIRIDVNYGNYNYSTLKPSTTVYRLDV